jgi:hypothetical protein
LAFITSITLAIFYNNSSPEATFFLLPFRVFEFTLGAGCVLIEQQIVKKKRFKYFNLIGFGLILFSSTAINHYITIPWLNSLFACFGTVLIILNGKNTFVNRILGNRLFELIGKISYSIYLIHWPLIVYYKYWFLTELNLIEKFSLGITSILLGFLMWKYIENPFRRSRQKKKETVFIWLPISIALFFLISWVIRINEGYPNRFSEVTNFLTKEELEKEKLRYWVNTSSKIKKIKSSKSDKKIIIMGNSHANDLTYALIDNGLNADVTFLATSSHCYNFGSPTKDKYINECLELKIKNLGYKEWENTDAIYLHDNWKKLDLNDLTIFLNEIRAISDAPIYVFGPKLTFSVPVLKIIHSSKSKSTHEINKYSKKHSKIDNRKYINNELIAYLNSDYFKNIDVNYIDILRLQCGSEYDSCKIVSTHNSKLLYFDKEHFTEQGAYEFGEKLKEAYPDLF